MMDCNIFQTNLPTTKIPLTEKISYLLHAVEQSSNAIVITDLDGTIEYVNKKFCQLTGYSKEEVLGRNPRIIKSGELPDFIYQELWQKISSGKNWQGEFHNIKKNGELFWDFTSISAIKNEHGENIKYLAIKDDINARKKAEENLQKTEQKLQQDFILAGKIQKSLLPTNISTPFFELISFYQPYRHVSGDTFDFSASKSGKKLIGYVADVMGHGLGTALQTSGLRILCHQILTERIPLSQRVKTVNKVSGSCFTEDSFAAIIAFEFDFIAMTLTYVTAGINSFLKLNNKKKSFIKAPGPFIGMLEDIDYEEHKIPISSNDVFCFMTDGITDLMESCNFSIKDLPDLYLQVETLVNINPCKDDATAILIKVK